MFNREILKEQLVKLDKATAKHYIGIDRSKNINSYCLVRHFDNVPEIILSKSIIDLREFNEEVSNLSKYFNAEIIEESIPL